MLDRSRVVLCCLLAGCAGGPTGEYPAVGSGNSVDGPGTGVTDGDSDDGEASNGHEPPPELPENEAPQDGDTGGEFGGVVGDAGLSFMDPGRVCGESESSDDAGTSDAGACTDDTCPPTRGYLISAAVPGGACATSLELDLVCNRTIEQVVGQCNERSLQESANFNQVETCALSDPSISAASDACVGCYLEANRCTLVNCLAECLTPATQASCNACRLAQCGDALSECTGLPAF